MNIDTLNFFKATLLTYKKCSHEYMVSHILKLYTSHDVVEDSEVLERLIELPQHASDIHFYLIRNLIY